MKKTNQWASERRKLRQVIDEQHNRIDELVKVNDLLGRRLRTWYFPSGQPIVMESEAAVRILAIRTVAEVDDLRTKVVQLEASIEVWKQNAKDVVNAIVKADGDRLTLQSAIDRLRGDMTRSGKLEFVQEAP